MSNRRNIAEARRLKLLQVSVLRLHMRTLKRRTVKTCYTDKVNNQVMGYSKYRTSVGEADDGSGALRGRT